MATKLKNLSVTSVDLVDRGANPDAHIRLFKRGEQPQETDPDMGLFQKFLRWLKKGFEDATGTDGQDGDYLRLSATEQSVLKGLAGLKKSGGIKKIIVLLNTANQIESEFIYDSDYAIDAALWVGHVGISGFNAVGDIVAGKVNPSGHLSDTYWMKHSYNPVNYNFGEFR